jgi:hypothetical protein
LKEPFGLINLPLPLASWADFGTFFRLGPAAAALLTRLHSGNFNVRGYACKRFKEVYFQIISQIASRYGAGPGSSTGGPEKILEDIRETRENILKPTETLETGSFKAFMTKLVVKLPFFLVAQNLVSFGGLFEILLSLLVTRIPVWMILES